MTNSIFQTARELIDQERYEEARSLLLQLDHPLAQDWIEKIDAKLARVKRDRAKESQVIVLDHASYVCPNCGSRKISTRQRQSWQIIGFGALILIGGLILFSVLFSSTRWFTLLATLPVGAFIVISKAFSRPVKCRKCKMMWVPGERSKPRSMDDATALRPRPAAATRRSVEMRAIAVTLPETSFDDFPSSNASLPSAVAMTDSAMILMPPAASTTAAPAPSSAGDSSTAGEMVWTPDPNPRPVSVAPKAAPTKFETPTSPQAILKRFKEASAEIPAVKVRPPLEPQADDQPALDPLADSSFVAATAFAPEANMSAQTGVDSDQQDGFWANLDALGKAPASTPTSKSTSAPTSPARSEIGASLTTSENAIWDGLLEPLIEPAAPPPTLILNLTTDGASDDYAPSTPDPLGDPLGDDPIEKVISETLAAPIQSSLDELLALLDERAPNSSKTPPPTPASIPTKASTPPSTIPLTPPDMPPSTIKSTIKLPPGDRPVTGDDDEFDLLFSVAAPETVTPDVSAVTPPSKIKPIGRSADPANKIDLVVGGSNHPAADPDSENAPISLDRTLPNSDQLDRSATPSVSNGEAIVPPDYARMSTGRFKPIGRTTENLRAPTINPVDTERFPDSPTDLTDAPAGEKDLPMPPLDMSVAFRDIEPAIDLDINIESEDDNTPNQSPNQANLRTDQAPSADVVERNRRSSAPASPPLGQPSTQQPSRPANENIIDLLTKDEVPAVAEVTVTDLRPDQTPSRAVTAGGTSDLAGPFVVVPPPPLATPPAIKSVGVTVPTDHDAVLKLMQDSTRCLIITGQTTVAKQQIIRRFIAGTTKQVVLLAVTGEGAIHVGGQMLQRFFRFPNRVIAKDELRLVRENAIYKAMDTLIIDEIALLRADFMDSIDQFLRLNGRDPQLPFGGVQIIGVGDVYSMAPVINEKEAAQFASLRYDSPYFFSAHVFTAHPPIVVNLASSAADNSPLGQLLTAIREDTIKRADLFQMNDHVDANFTPPANLLFMTMVSTPDAAEKVNAARLAALGSPTLLFEGMISGNFANDCAPTFPVEPELRLKVGSQVMFMENDSYGRWHKGGLARIHQLDQDRIMVEMVEGAYRSVLTLTKMTWETQRHVLNDAGKPVTVRTGTFTQYPIRLAWALAPEQTIGLTFERLIVDIAAGATAPGAAYMALSRARTLEKVVLRQPMTEASIRLSTALRSFINA